MESTPWKKSGMEESLSNKTYFETEEKLLAASSPVSQTQGKQQMGLKFGNLRKLTRTHTQA